VEKPINTRRRVVSLDQKHCVEGEPPPFEKKTGKPEPENPDVHSAKSIQLIKQVPILAGLTATSSDSSSPDARIAAGPEHG
jgi:hypothetical protein